MRVFQQAEEQSAAHSVKVCHSLVEVLSTLRSYLFLKQKPRCTP